MRTEAEVTWRPAGWAALRMSLRLLLRVRGAASCDLSFERVTDENRLKGPGMMQGPH